MTLNLNKIIAIFVLLLAASATLASEKHYPPPVTVTEEVNIYNEYYNNGIALGMAFDHSYDYGTTEWQGDATFACYDNCAASILFAKRFTSNGPLVKAAVGYLEGGNEHLPWSIGLHWRF